MEPALVAALLAAAVSLVGVLASLRMARQALAASRAQIVLTTGLKVEEVSIQTLRVYSSAIEKLRVECWYLISAVRWVIEGRDEGRDMEMLRSAVQVFHAKSLAFLEAWAEVRPEITSPALDVIRMMRHDIRRKLETIIATATDIASARRRRREARETLRSIDSDVRTLLQDLDHFLGFVVSLKDDRLRELFPAAETNDALHPPALRDVTVRER